MVLQINSSINIFIT